MRWWFAIRALDAAGSIVFGGTVNGAAALNIDLAGDATFNATGFALNFESGSMKAMAETMGKEAKMKLRLFLLPPVGDLPLFMSINVGWVWY